MGNPKEQTTTLIPPQFPEGSTNSRGIAGPSKEEKAQIEAQVTQVIISHFDIFGLQAFINFDPSTLLKNHCPKEKGICWLIGVNEDGQLRQSPEEFIARAIFKTLRIAWNLEPQEQQGLMSSIAGYCQTLATRGQTPESILQLYCQHFKLLPRQQLWGGRVNPEEPGPNNQERESASAFFARLSKEAWAKRPEIGETIPVETHPQSLSTRAKFPPRLSVKLAEVGELPEE